MFGLNSQAAIVGAAVGRDSRVVAALLLTPPKAPPGRPTKRDDVIDI